MNFDHPAAIEFALLARCLAQLKRGESTEIPIYDFVTHSRAPRTLAVGAKPVIVVDGILIAHAPEVRGLCDALIYFDTPEDLRYQRRLERDVHERGRTPEGVRNQFLRQVKPMHDTFVEPSKAHATRTVRTDGEFELVLREFLNKFGR